MRQQEVVPEASMLLHLSRRETMHCRRLGARLHAMCVVRVAATKSIRQERGGGEQLALHQKSSLE